MTHKNTSVVIEFVSYGTDKKIKSKHLYFEQDVLFSYGFHFPLCIRLKDCWLINKDGYSTTTSTHRGHLIREITGNYSLKKIKNDIEDKKREDIKLLSTEELKGFINEDLSENGLRFITFEELNRLKIIKNLN